MSLRKIKRHRLALQGVRVGMRKLLGIRCEAVALPQVDGTVRLQIKAVLSAGEA